MAKESSPGARKSLIAKAGKRRGQVNYPMMASNEKLASQEQGEQQFVSNKQLTVDREATIIVYDKVTKKFEYKTKKITLPTEYVYDKNRKRVVYSPSYKEKK